MDYWSKDYKFYSNWARKEIVRFIKENPGKSKIELLEIFIKKMDRYSCMNSKTSIIFSVAHDIALDILDKLLIM